MGQMNVLTGFVVGTKQVTDNKVVWFVRVDDTSSELHGRKFEVGTYKIELIQGLVVEFMLGTVLVGKKQVRKAIEVIAKECGGNDENTTTRK